jgi:hypothetical protein
METAKSETEEGRAMTEKTQTQLTVKASEYVKYRLQYRDDVKFYCGGDEVLSDHAALHSDAPYCFLLESRDYGTMRPYLPARTLFVVKPLTPAAAAEFALTETQRKWLYALKRGARIEDRRKTEKKIYVMRGSKTLGTITTKTFNALCEYLATTGTMRETECIR